MSELQDKMDTVGWMSPNDADYHHAIFQWMREATREIRRLQTQIQYLEAMTPTTPKGV